VMTNFSFLCINDSLRTASSHLSHNLRLRLSGVFRRASLRHRWRLYFDTNVLSSVLSSLESTSSQQHGRDGRDDDDDEGCATASCAGDECDLVGFRVRDPGTARNLGVVGEADAGRLSVEDDVSTHHETVAQESLGPRAGYDRKTVDHISVAQLGF